MGIHKYQLNHVFRSKLFKENIFKTTTALRSTQNNKKNIQYFIFYNLSVINSWFISNYWYAIILSFCILLYTIFTIHVKYLLYFLFSQPLLFIRRFNEFRLYYGILRKRAIGREDSLFIIHCGLLGKMRFSAFEKWILTELDPSVSQQSSSRLFV